MNDNRKKAIASEEDKERLIREGAETALQVDVLTAEWSDNQVLLFEDQQFFFGLQRTPVMLDCKTKVLPGRGLLS